jgi:hypothetical protein
MRKNISTSSSRPKSPTSIRKNDSGTSGISLEHSIGSAMMVGFNSVGGSTFTSTVGGSTVESSLLGQNYAADGSIMLMALSSAVTPATKCSLPETT